MRWFIDGEFCTLCVPVWHKVKMILKMFNGYDSNSVNSLDNFIVPMDLEFNELLPMNSATNTFGHVDWLGEYIMLKIVKSGGENY